jgi:hypothetical protein
MSNLASGWGGPYYWGGGQPSGFKNGLSAPTATTTAVRDDPFKLEP